MATAHHQLSFEADPLRYELRLSIAALDSSHGSLSVVQLCDRANAVRVLAARHGHEPARQIAQAFCHAVALRGRGVPIHLFIRALGDAVDCDPADRSASELLLAAVNVHRAC